VKTDSSFDGIADFDSPIPSKNVGDCDNNRGVNEIKDILNDLTSRLDLLSIEKRRMPENGSVVKKVDVVEYASAESSFSSSSGPSDSSSNVNKNFVEAYEDGHLLSESFADEVDSKGNDICKGLKKNEYGRVDEKLVPVGKSFASNVVEEEGDVQIVSGRDDYVTRVEKTNKVALKVKKNEPTRFHEKLRSVGRSSLLSLRDEPEDKGDDCEVLTSKKVVKKVGRPDAIAKYNLLSDESSVTDVLDNHADSEDDSCITLPGPKSTYKLSGTIAKMLYPHQREGLRWLWSLHCQGKGGILGDDMGLGKTMQVRKCVQ
jgi:SNF2 family DNA or RNA helicase